MKAPESPSAHPKVKIWIKVFVLFHILCITIWALPNPPEAIEERRMRPAGTQWIPYLNQMYLKSFPPVVDYLFLTGFWQYWDMFAPNPAQTDQWAAADVVYRDGTVRPFKYPRIYDLPIPEKYLKERYRKFFERSGKAGKLDYTYFWPVFGLRIALMMDDPKNPPVAVKLYRMSREVAGPGVPQPQQYHKEMYFEYAVDPKDLQRLRGIH